MTYRLEILPSALLEIEEAAHWYDAHDSGLGADFLREVMQAVDSLGE